MYREIVALRSQDISSVSLQETKRILIVEDEPLIAYDLISAIESENHTVVGQTNSADEAVDLAGQLEPDVVIMDIGLLGKQSGLEAARQIRQRHGIGCIFVSATLDRIDPDDWSGIEPVALIRKPYRDRTLSAAISKTNAA